MLGSFKEGICLRAKRKYSTKNTLTGKECIVKMGEIAIVMSSIHDVSGGKYSIDLMHSDSTIITFSRYSVSKLNTLLSSLYNRAI